MNKIIDKLDTELIADSDIEIKSILKHKKTKNLAKKIKQEV